MWVLFRSCFAIWHFLFCALRAARRFSIAALFQLKTASSGRGALAGKMGALQLQQQEVVKISWGETSSEKIVATTKANKTHREDKQTYIFFCPHVGEHRE
jgi:uncharacterized Fe-S center protein